MRRMLLVLTAGLLASAAPAFAQAEEPAAPTGAPEERVNQLIVYGEDECPQGGPEEIVVCARLPDEERYRIPPGLRSNPNDRRNESWTNRAIELSYVGRSGIGSCSPVGPGGFVGCHNELVRQARAERRASRGVNWTSLVDEARRAPDRRVERAYDNPERARDGGD